MKERVSFLIILFVIGIGAHQLKAQSQVDFGVKGGLNLTFFKVAEGNFGDNPETATGFYGGLFTDFNIDNNFSIQPEILYIVLNDFNFMNAPIYAKYQVGDNLYLSVGPSLNYFFDFFTNKFKIRGDIATSYNITSKIDLHVKYTLRFQEITPNGLFVGVGLKL
ncbi:Outer membrane protein beta-barrel domain-containing protein [Hyunsoonleella jejuensis]|uniref:Outer membrane protein beta-barrel domain-containing protein n=1 Tax=Hyunsoonleella jejuensis TaxID=419940 RepID=A0A1H9FH09_9FLAO|nr:outer membrane beta-barrel protein [Hyunsoonleella jejuensis]SEQ37210.1 Outer membrane protein beta-barrel domain-containing protein [Hyunsoonleella jejuensis]